MPTPASLLETIADSWNAGDAPRYADCFAPDAWFVDALGRVQRGNAVIATEHAKLFDTIYAGSRLRLWEVERRDLGAGFLLLHVGSRLDVPRGPRAGVTNSIQTMLVRDGRVEAFQNTMVVDVAGFAGHDEGFERRAPLDWAGS